MNALNTKSGESPDSVYSLWRDYKLNKNIEERNRLVEHYAGLVKCIAFKIAGHYQYFSYMDDIINEGIIALLDAVEKFDFSKNVKFETFASIKIRGAIIDFIRKQDCFPRRLKKMAKTIALACEKLGQSLGREPNDNEIADYLGVSLEEYDKMASQACSLSMLSFEEIVYEKDVDSFAMGESPPNSRPERVIAEKELRRAVADGIDKLDIKEKTVISLYYKEHLKIKEISRIMDVSESRVSQIHSKALQQLKKILQAYINM